MSKRQIKVIIDGTEYIVEVGDLSERPVRATVNQRTYDVQVDSSSSSTSAVENKPALEPTAASPPARTSVPTPVPAVGANVVAAPMPGDIVDVYVKVGDHVGVGQDLCSLEAMKMKNMIRSPRTAVVAEVHVSPGQAVAHGEALISFE
jgi:biotin carboxyl carrier protein